MTAPRVSGNFGLSGWDRAISFYPVASQRQFTWLGNGVHVSGLSGSALLTASPNHWLSPIHAMSFAYEGSVLSALTCDLVSSIFAKWGSVIRHVSGLFPVSICQGSTKIFVVEFPLDFREPGGVLELKSHSLSFNHAKGSTTIWIGAGSGLAVIFAGIGGIVLILASRRAIRSVTTMTESEVEEIAPMDSEISMAVNPFASEENALSVDILDE
jgi:hypothetical protein